MDLFHPVPRPHPSPARPRRPEHRDVRHPAATILPAALILLALLCPFPSRAATQSVPLVSGFNFVSPIVTPEPAIDSAALLHANGAVEQVFAFDEAGQSFRYQLELPSGDLFGTPVEFRAGRGYILKCRSEGTLSFTGGAAPDRASFAAAAGFNLAGFPPLVNPPNAAELLAAHALLRSVFKWNAATAAFEFVLKLEQGTFGSDFPLEPGAAYFLNTSSSGTVHFGVPASTPATVAGRVATGAGAPLAGATVVLFAADASVAATAQSDENGDFSLSAALPGTYRLLALKAGFQDAASADFAVEAGGTVARDLALAPLETGGDTTPPANQDTVLPANATVTSGTQIAIGSAGETGGAVWLAPAGTSAFFEGVTMTRAEGTATALPAPLHQGAYKLYVVDAAGNVSAPSTATVTVQNPVPTNQDLVLAASAWRRGGESLAIAPAGNPLHAVWLAPAGTTAFARGTTMASAAGGATSISVPVWEGAYRLFVVDELARASSPSVETVTVDNTAPAVSLADSVGTRAAVRDADAVTITATFTEASGVDEASPPRISIGTLVGSASMSKSSNLVWTYAWDVPAGNDGLQEVRVSALDRAGNAASAATGKSAYRIDNTPPANQDAVLPAAVTVAANGAVAVTPAGESGGFLWLAPAGTTHFSEGLAVTRASGTASSIVAPAVAGLYRIYVMDEAGNVSPPSAASVTVTAAWDPVLTLNAVNGQFVAPLPLLRADETVVVAAYSLIATSYQMTSRILSSAPGLAPAPDTAAPSLSAAPDPAVDPGPAFAGRDRRSRATERATAQVQESATGASAAPRRAPSRAPTVGATGQFYALNSLAWPPSTSDWTNVTATCKAVGTHCYLFQDNNPGSYKPYPESAWPILQEAFDQQIYAQITAAFGEEPRPPKDVDGDARIYVLFTHNVNKQSASGYFDSTNELTQAQANTLGGGTYYSNQKEILFMQVPSWSFDWGDDLRNHVCGVMAHEFLHMIVYNQRVMLPGLSTNEEDWVNEGLAQVAQDVAGFGYQHGTLSFVMQPFLSSPGSYSLTNFSFNLGQYGMSYLFFRHLVDRGAATRAMGATTLRGQANVEAASGKPLAELFRDFAIALYASNTGVSSNPVHNFTSINLRATQADGTVFNGPAMAVTRTSFPNSYYGSLRAGGIHYLRHTGGTGANAEITLTGGSGFGATSIRRGP